MNSAQARPVAPKPVTGQRLLIPATNSQTKSNQATIATIPASALSQIQGKMMLLFSVLLALIFQYQQ